MCNRVFIHCGIATFTLLNCDWYSEVGDVTYFQLCFDHFKPVRRTHTKTPLQTLFMLNVISVFYRKLCHVGVIISSKKLLRK